jgi:uncharacterized membrane protein
MEYLIAAFLLVALPLAGLFGCRTRLLRSMWALILTGEAFACGWGLSSFIGAMSAWNRYGEPAPSHHMTIVFAIVVAILSFMVIIIAPGIKTGGGDARGRDPEDS